MMMIIERCSESAEDLKNLRGHEIMTGILALSTAVPPYIYLQREMAQKFIDVLEMNAEKATSTRRMYAQSGIEQRHSVIEDLNHAKEKWEFLDFQYPQIIPGMTHRNQRYKEEAPKLAVEAGRLALERWGGEISRITHVISISCTGIIAPGIEYYLMEKLGLPSTVNRLGINFMGCFGAFKGLSVAHAFAKENSRARILLVCTELCSLHLQASQDIDTLTANCIFADGSGAAVVGNDLDPEETALWEIDHSYSMGFKDSFDKMSWEASDHGFTIRLSPTVPVIIRRHIKQFVDDLLQAKANVGECDWAIHPGGKSILQVVEKSIQLQEHQTKSSWEVLRRYGNMSSATFLFVLEELSRQTFQHPWCAGIGFGPGLSAEGILLRHPQTQRRS